MNSLYFFQFTQFALIFGQMLNTFIVQRNYIPVATAREKIVFI